jgi:hypothetical protein
LASSSLTYIGLDGAVRALEQEPNTAADFEHARLLNDSLRYKLETSELYNFIRCFNLFTLLDYWKKMSTGLLGKMSSLDPSPPSPGERGPGANPPTGPADDTGSGGE